MTTGWPEIVADALTRTCPVCHAEPTQPCVSPYAPIPDGSVHRYRIREDFRALADTDRFWCAECKARGDETEMIPDTVNDGCWLCPKCDRLEGELTDDDLAVLADPVSTDLFLRDPTAPRDHRGILGELRDDNPDD